MNGLPCSPGVDFKKVSLMQALDLAVTIEEEARDRYLELADALSIAHTPEASEFFRKMARMEEKHRVALLTKRRASFGDRPSTVGRLQIFDVEAPDYDTVRAFMTVRQALDVALQSERKAHAFFKAALAETSDPEARFLFAELVAEESDHEAYVQAEIARQATDPWGDPPGDPAAYSDEPVPQ
ncbi:MAG: ferritin family protein [Planctomycetes bacterium]|nr:ferritin family protein [Planctomycetota bacterium]